MDVRGWTDKKMDSHAASIDVLTAKVAADASKLEQNALKRSKTAAGAVAEAPVQALPMKEGETSRLKEGETSRLIYARKVMDVEFDKCVNSQVSKREKVADLWNNGFVVKSKILAGVREDIVFPALPVGEHATGARLQNRWEKVSKEYRDLMLLKQNVDNEMKKRTHIGEKRGQDEIRLW
jgi:hypothetical protein